MKNIHVLPTDKPSRFFNTNKGEFHFVEHYIPDTIQTCKNHNIYITSDEEIKMGDWYIIEFNGITITKCTSEEELISIEGRNDCQKIILTTDQVLISNEVQAIDDEFLEWFVKNPSCESVEVKPLLSNNGRALFGYKIIIPKEEPKTKCYCGHTTYCDCGPIEEKMKHKIYLDDVRTPVDPSWIVVRNYEEFIQKINTLGLENIDLISLDHDLGDTAMSEWLYGVTKNYSINYDNITEKTGMDCTKWLVNQWMDGKPVVDVVVHSANAIGSGNMMGYINNYRHLNRMPQNCVRVQIEHTV